MEAKLVVVGGEASTGEIKLKQLPSVIGRGHDADVRLTHPLVSRRHCEIREADGLLVVQDLGSLNGTFIGDNRITESVLRPDELITIGPVVFRAVYDAPKGSTVIARTTAKGADKGAAAAKLPSDARKTAPIRDTVQSVQASNKDADDADDFDLMDDLADFEDADEVADAEVDVEEVSEVVEVAESKGIEEISGAEPTDDADFDWSDLADDEPQPAAPAAKAAPKPSVQPSADPKARTATSQGVTAKPAVAGTATKNPAKPAKENETAELPSVSAKSRNGQSGEDDPELDDFLKGLGLDE